MGITAGRKKSWSFEDPNIHIPQRGCRRGLRATGWMNVLDTAKGKRAANVNGLSVSNSLT